MARVGQESLEKQTKEKLLSPAPQCGCARPSEHRTQRFVA